MMGSRAGSKLTSGGSNTFLGASAGRYVTSGDQTLLLVHSHHTVSDSG